MEITHKTEDDIIQTKKVPCDCYVATLKTGLQIRFDYLSPEDLGGPDCGSCFDAVAWDGRLHMYIYAIPDRKKAGRYEMAVEYLLDEGPRYCRSFDDGFLRRFSQRISAASDREALRQYVLKNLEALLATIKENN